MKSAPPAQRVTVQVPVSVPEVSIYGCLLSTCRERLGTWQRHSKPRVAFVYGRLRPKPAKIQAGQEFGVSHDRREALSGSLRAARVGKLPIAEAISAQTDWILFDNSAAIDFVAQFLPPATPRFLELIDSLRLDLIRAMLAEGRSVVFTFVYFGFDGEDISFFKFLTAAATSVGASVHLVQLRCSEETLLKRISNASWDQSAKPTTPQKLPQTSKYSQFEKTLSGFASLQIDTDSCGPDGAASMIVECVRKEALAQRC